MSLDPLVRQHRPAGAAASEDVVKLADLDRVRMSAAEPDLTMADRPAADSVPLGEAVLETLLERGGRRKGLEATRYGDWEKNGRCIDF